MFRRLNFIYPVKPNLILGYLFKGKILESEGGDIYFLWMDKDQWFILLK